MASKSIFLKHVASTYKNSRYKKIELRIEFVMFIPILYTLM